MDQPWVKELRAQFPVTSRLAFFDIAYENCGALFVREAAETYFQHKADIYPGIVKAGGVGKGETISVVEDARRLLAQFLNAPGDKNLAFAANTCQAVNLALQGLSFQPGDNVVVGRLEHVSVLMPCLHLRQRGVICRAVGAADSLFLTAEELLAQTDAHTRVVVVSYVQSCSGYKIDLKHLVEECHRRGILVITDAIQALGFQRIDVQDLGVDALAASCYKGLLGTEGVGFLYCSDAFLEQLHPVFAGPSHTMTIDRDTLEIRCADPLDARKMEAGTLPFQSIYSLRAGLNALTQIGMEQIERHVSVCFEQVYRGLEALGYRLATPFESAHRCNSMLVQTGHNHEMTDYFLRHGVFFSCGRDGYIRLSIAPFTSQEDIDRLMRVAAAWRLEQQGNGEAV